MEMKECAKHEKAEGIKSPARRGGKMAMKGAIRAKMNIRAKGKKQD